jgi:tRNA G18 (ribose-2'-O)-methylase SpoU
MGHVLGVPFATLPRWPDDLHLLRHNGFRLLALTPRAGSTPLDRATGLAGARVALLLGAEGPGLSTEALAAADELVSVPMAPGVDSLNVATAAAIAFYAVGLTCAPGQVDCPPPRR